MSALPVVDAAVARMFERMFPGVAFVEFSCSRREHGCTRNSHMIEYEGPIARLLELRLVSPEMVPVPPKLTRRGCHQGPRTHAGWDTRRRKHRRLRVWRELTEDVPEDDALEPFCGRHWPITDQMPELLEYYRLTFANAATTMAETIWNWALYLESTHKKACARGVRLRQADTQQLYTILADFEDLAEIARSLRTEPIHRPVLRVAWTNPRACLAARAQEQPTLHQDGGAPEIKPIATSHRGKEGAPCAS